MPRFLVPIRRSIGVKLLIVSELVLGVTIVLMLAAVLPQMRNQIIVDIQNRLMAIANTAALQLPGDVVRTIRVPADAETPAFRQLRATLAAIRDVNGLSEEHIYTFYVDPDDASMVRFGVMTHARPFVGDPYPLREMMRPVFAEGAGQVTDLYEDANGQWISAYAPIRDSAGEVVALLEVDERADKYFENYHVVRTLTAALGLAVLAVSSLAGWLVVNRLLLRPMRAVQDGMQALSRSEFAHRVALRTGDEFELLGETFNRLAKEMNAARSVQASFAPRDIPSAGGWSIAAASEPCDATAGDYVDAFGLPGGRIAVVVADVTGHGLGPALLMSACRSTLRALAGLDLSPAEVVDRLDAMLRDDLADGRFITLIFGILEPDGRLTYCNAGHGPTLLVRGDGPLRRADALPPHRPPVGVGWETPEGEEAETSLWLSPGERLLLASDGVTEAWSEQGEQFGDDRLARLAVDETLAGREVVRRVGQALAHHRGRRPQSDDVTILCVDRTADDSAAAAAAPIAAVATAATTGSS